MARKTIRVLGSFISYNEKENEKYTFALKLQKLKTIFNICMELSEYITWKVPNSYKSWHLATGTISLQP